MPTAPNLPTDVAPGDPGHATLHNDVNESVNLLAADTGWRAMGSVPGFAALYFRRLGDTVHMLAVTSVLQEGNSAGGSGTIPTGFRHDFPDYAELAIGYAGADGTLNLTSADPDNLTVYCASGELDGMAGSMTWTTPDAWPDPLPGTPA
jgi:hypothetical protein